MPRFVLLAFFIVNAPGAKLILKKEPFSTAERSEGTKISFSRNVETYRSGKLIRDHCHATPWHPQTRIAQVRGAGLCHVSAARSRAASTRFPSLHDPCGSFFQSNRALCRALCRSFLPKNQARTERGMCICRVYLATTSLRLENKNLMLQKLNQKFEFSLIWQKSKNEVK